MVAVSAVVIHSLHFIHLFLTGQTVLRNPDIISSTTMFILQILTVPTGVLYFIIYYEALY